MADDTTAMRTDLKDLKRDMDALRDDLGRLVNDLGAQARMRFADGSAVAGKWANEAGERAQVLARDARHQIEERPGTTAAVAFGVGILLGFLVSSSSRR